MRRVDVQWAVYIKLKIIRLNMRALFILFFTAVLFTANGQAGDPPAGKSTIFDLMYHDDVVKMELVLDVYELVSNRRTEEYQEVVLTFKDEHRDKQVWEAKARVRGRFRRRICNFPPIKIKFDKDDLKASNLKKHNELKLVTHCLDDKEGEQNLLREYLAYKLYEQISPYHYRAQLIKIKYVDQVSGESLKTYGILLEDEKELAARYDTDLCEDCYSLTRDSLDLENLYNLSLFQYMIGNADWSIPMLRNVKMLRDDKTGIFYAAPYDFDFTGLVNASYASPDPTLNIKTVRERVFLGLAESNEELEPAIDYFLEKKPALMRTIEDFRFLKKVDREDIMAYIESFYREIEQRGLVLVERSEEGAPAEN